MTGTYETWAVNDLNREYVKLNMMLVHHFRAIKAREKHQPYQPEHLLTYMQAIETLGRMLAIQTVLVDRLSQLPRL